MKNKILNKHQYFFIFLIYFGIYFGIYFFLGGGEIYFEIFDDFSILFRYFFKKYEKMESNFKTLMRMNIESKFVH